MPKNASLNAHNYIRSFIIIGFSLYIAYLFKQDTLQYYLAPRMMVYLKWACVLLFLIGGSQLFLVFRSRRAMISDCDCEHLPSRSTFVNIVSYGLLLIPLGFGFLLPDTAMNSALAAKRGMILNISSAISPINKPLNAAVAANIPIDIPPPLSQSQSDYAELASKLQEKAMIQINPEIYLEELTAFNLFPDQFVGKEIAVTGFIYREPVMKDNEMIVARFALQCCSADATPYGIMVEYPHAASYAKDTWVTITGTIQKTTYKDTPIIKIDATKIKKIEAPKSQYVYPNLEFLDEDL